MTFGSTWPFSRVFITGGSGYVGRNLIRHFRAKSIPVTALARSQRSERTVAELGAVPFQGSLIGTDLVPGIEGCDVLIHAAAEVGDAPSTRTQQCTNEEGTRVVFKAARAAGVQRAIHLSSAAVLADGRPLVDIDETYPIPRRPLGPYARSKADAERNALSYNGSGMDVMVIRPHLVWGRDNTSWLPGLVTAASLGSPKGFGSGDFLTTTTHIANLCHGVDLALAYGRGGEIYFLGDDDWVKHRDFLNALLAAQALKVTQRYPTLPFPRQIARAADWLERLSRGKIGASLVEQLLATPFAPYTFSSGKARREWGYVPVMRREGGLAELAARAEGQLAL